MSTDAWAGRLGVPPRPPELPDGARPRWPAWYGFAAMGAGTVVVVVAAIPLVPVALAGVADDGAVGAFALLVLLLVQDCAYVGTAVGFGWLDGRPPPWHFGLRSTPVKRTLAITVGAGLLILGFELGYVELLGVDEGNTDDLGGGANAVAALAVSLAVIVVAPVTEELFFRAFFYRALRNRMGVAVAALLDGLIFGALHFGGTNSADILPIIAVFGVATCLVYEATGSVFSTIAIHAAFNTLAMAGTEAGVAVPIAVGVAVLAACILVPPRLGPAPSPFLARA